MNKQAGVDDLPDYPYVSTGHLPPADEVVRLVGEAHARYKSNTDGKNSQVYPALAEVPSELFGVCVVGTDGAVLLGRRCRARILDHERLQAVRLRAGLPGDRRGAGAREAGRERHRICRSIRSPASNAARTAGQIRWSMRARSPRPAWCRARPPMPNGGSSTTDCPDSPAASCR